MCGTSLKAGANGAALAFASAAPYATIALLGSVPDARGGSRVSIGRSAFRIPSILVTDLYGVPGLKHAMDLNGYYGGPPRLPFVPVSADARREIEERFAT